MAADPDRTELATLLGPDAADALRDWARLNDLSVAPHLPAWSPPGKGYTGAVLQALEVAPPARTVILKVLPADAHRDEPRAHARALKASPAAFAAGHLVGQAFPPYPLADGRVLMFQDAADDGLRHTAPLLSLSGEEFTRTCAEVVRGLLTEWNPADREQAPRRMPVSAFLRRELGAAWSGHGTVQVWGRRASWLGDGGPGQPWVSSDGSRLPNPYLMVTGHPALPDPEVSVLTGLAHRDLHLENILVPRRRGVPYSAGYRLIDLATVTTGAPLTCDIATMLLSALAPCVREPMPSAQQRALLEYVVNPHQAHSARIPPEVAERVDCVRDTAAEVMRRWHDPWTDQFLLSIQAAALIFTSFTDLGDAGREWYMRLAAHAGGQLLRSRGVPLDSGEGSSPSNDVARAAEFPIPVGPVPPPESVEGRTENAAIGPDAVIGGAGAGPVPGALTARTSPPNGRPPSLDRRKRLVLALEAVPSMADPQSRAAVLRLLPAELATSVVRSSVTRLDVIGVVDTCLDFPGGLVRLWEALSVVDTGTRALDELAGILAEMPEFQPPPKSDQ